jgi:hypothetical protein
MSKATDFFYYTPIVNKLNFEMFRDYLNKVKNENIDDNLADTMAEIDNMIVSSNAFKQQENKPIINQTKWQAYKVKKLPLTSLFMILNKMNNDNMELLVEESLQYKTFSFEDINQLADVFLGKCIVETKNVKMFIDYFKNMMDYKLWYTKNGDSIVSFREIMMDRLENEYDRLTTIAGHIEDVYKNRIRDEENLNELDGSEEYLKKKNIILSLIELIGIFFNSKIISHSLLDHIFDKLNQQYDDLTSKKIYLEIWLTLWNSVSYNLYKYFRSDYNTKSEWLTQQKNKLIEYITEKNDSKNNVADVSRLINLIENSIAKSYENINIINKENEDKIELEKSMLEKISNEESLSFDKLEDKIKKLKTQDEYRKFKSIYTNDTIKNFVIKYMFDNVKGDDSVIKITMNNIKTYLINNDELHEIVDSLLENDEIICDYPNFEKYIKNYL